MSERVETTQALPTPVEAALKRARLLGTAEAWLRYRRLLRQWREFAKRKAEAEASTAS